jgi:hypothetical protein
MLNRTVSIVPMVETAEDRYGDKPRVPGAPVPGQRCRRRQLTADEDVLDRDQQARTFVYEFLPSVVVTGRDRILDGDDTLEVVGEPNLVTRRHRPHHVLLRASVVQG